MAGFRIPAIPGELKWQNDPVDWALEDDSRLSVTAGPSTDWFLDPRGIQVRTNAPLALFTADDGDFQLQARVTVDFASTFDAGVLMAFVGDDLWGKLCFEYSPQGKAMVVSVVTKGVSDDCNSVIIDGKQVYLRISRIGPAFAFHYAIDGSYWHMVRHFTLGEVPLLRTGFSAQSPTGHECSVIFDEIGYQRTTLEDICSGV